MTSPAFIAELVDDTGEQRSRRLTFRKAEETPTGTQVIVHNLSLSGMVVETSTSFATGEVLEVVLPDESCVAAKIAWINGGLAGCEFEVPISRRALGGDQPRGAAGPGADIGNTGSQTSFGSRLRLLRVTRGITQDQLATHLGVSGASVSAWEGDRARPVAARTEALAQILGVSLMDLLGHEEQLSLPELIAQARRAIAQAAGVEDDRVKINIEM